MGKGQTLPSLISERKIGDNILVSIYDRSRTVAGDRWRIELVCEAKLQVAEDNWTRLDKEDPEIAACIRTELGAVLTYSYEIIRNFIDQKEKDKLIDESIRQLEENILHYITKPGFPQKLFDHHYRLARQKCLVAQQQRQSLAALEEDDDEPADFSHLFTPR